MLLSGRLHVDCNLEDRIQFIMKPYEYICKDETDINKMLNEIHSYSGKDENESWNELLNRSGYKDLVLDLRDVFDLLTFINTETKTLNGHLFFIAPKIDFRQGCAPNFLCE